MLDTSLLNQHRSARRTAAMTRTTATLIPGDGIGPEIMHGVQRVFAAVEAPIDWEIADAGEAVFAAGIASGVPRETIDSIAKNRVVLKGPLATPIGTGGKSANVTLRKLFETFGNIRPVREFPGVGGPFAGRNIDLVVVRENVEDLYAGIEHQQTPNVAQCLKLVSYQGCARIARLAFELARAEGRRTVHCATKANIMKLTEGLMKRAFEDVARDYPDIAAAHLLVDNCAHQLVRHPEQFEVIVTTNMNGDILSDLTSGLVGGLGFAPSANIGDGIAIFEAVHGSAPGHAGRDTANPTAGILSGVMLLRHLGHFLMAERIEQAVAATLAAGVHTGDVAEHDAVGTERFVDTVIDKLHAQHRMATTRQRRQLTIPPRPPAIHSENRMLIGVDVFVESDLAPAALGDTLRALDDWTGFELRLISNRGTQVYPTTGATPDCVDHYRCRFMLRDPNGHNVQDVDLAIGSLLDRVGTRMRWMHVEKLQVIDGEPGFTRAQGEN